MLRVSVDHIGEDTLQLPPIASGIGDAGLTAGAELLAFVDAVVLRDHDEYATARSALERIVGRPATDRAAMIAGNFSMMNRALDAVGAPVDSGYDEIAAGIGVTTPAHLRR